MPKVKLPIVTSYQTGGATDDEDTFHFVSSVEQETNEEITIPYSRIEPNYGSQQNSGASDPLTELVGSNEETAKHDSNQAVLDFALSGDDDFLF